MYEDWIKLQHGLEDSRREANRRAEIARRARINASGALGLLQAIRERVVSQNTTSVGTFITPPTYWLGQHDT